MDRYPSARLSPNQSLCQTPLSPSRELSSYMYLNHVLSHKGTIVSGREYSDALALRSTNIAFGLCLESESPSKPTEVFKSVLPRTVPWVTGESSAPELWLTQRTDGVYCILS